jgi:interleukin-1 receptor-associated kinase 1
MYIYELSNKNHSQHNFPILISLFMDLNLKCGKCHKAGHHTRSCDKISHVGGNSKLPNASEAITEKRTSSTQSTVQQDCQRSEASSGVVTKTLQTTPSK